MVIAGKTAAVELLELLTPTDETAEREELASELLLELLTLLEAIELGCDDRTELLLERALLALLRLLALLLLLELRIELLDDLLDVLVLDALLVVVPHSAPRNCGVSTMPPLVAA